MKYLKHIYLLPLLFILSCSKDDSKQVCGQETKVELIISNYSEFSKVKNTLIDGEAEYSSYYNVFSTNIDPGFILWGIQVKLSNICNSDTPRIDFGIRLQVPDSTIKVGRLITENQITNLIGKLNASPDKSFFNSNDLFIFTNNSNSSRTIFALLYFQMPSLGSFRLDSNYLFSNLETMACRIIAHKPE